MKPHTYHGYEHNERDSDKGASNLTLDEKEWWIEYGRITLAENSLGGQNTLMDEASVQFRLTARDIAIWLCSFFMVNI